MCGSNHQHPRETLITATSKGKKQGRSLGQVCGKLGEKEDHDRHSKLRNLAKRFRLNSQGARREHPQGNMTWKGPTRGKTNRETRPQLCDPRNCIFRNSRVINQMLKKGIITQAGLDDRIKVVEYRKRKFDSIGPVDEDSQCGEYVRDAPTATPGPGPYPNSEGSKGDEGRLDALRTLCDRRACAKRAPHDAGYDEGQSSRQASATDPSPTIPYRRAEPQSSAVKRKFDEALADDSVNVSEGGRDRGMFDR
jgi:hypothetical protein